MKDILMCFMTKPIVARIELDAETVGWQIIGISVGSPGFNPLNLILLGFRTRYCIVNLTNNTVSKIFVPNLGYEWI